MQDKLVTKAGLSSWPVTHSSSTHSHLCELSLIPCHSDPCQASVTFGWGRGFHAVHTNLLFDLFTVFICFFVFAVVCLHCVRLMHFYLAAAVRVRRLVFLLITSGCFTLQCPSAPRCWISPVSRPALDFGKLCGNFSTGFLFLNCCMLHPKQNKQYRIQHDSIHECNFTGAARRAAFIIWHILSCSPITFNLTFKICSESCINPRGRRCFGFTCSLSVWCKPTGASKMHPELVT